MWGSKIGRLPLNSKKTSDGGICRLHASIAGSEQSTFPPLPRPAVERVTVDQDAVTTISDNGSFADCLGSLLDEIRDLLRMREHRNVA